MKKSILLPFPTFFNIKSSTPPPTTTNYNHIAILMYIPKFVRGRPHHSFHLIYIMISSLTRYIPTSPFFGFSFVSFLPCIHCLHHLSFFICYFLAPFFRVLNLKIVPTSRCCTQLCYKQWDPFLISSKNDFTGEKNRASIITPAESNKTSPL